jgi:hypothetical protein
MIDDAAHPWARWMAKRFPKTTDYGAAGSPGLLLAWQAGKAFLSWHYRYWAPELDPSANNPPQVIENCDYIVSITFACGG